MDTGLNSRMRTINLTTYILAPIAVTQIIDFGSPEAGAIFIAVWNLISAGIEYHLLLQIYKVVPELSTKTQDIPFVKISTPSSTEGSPNSDPNANKSSSQENLVPARRPSDTVNNNLQLPSIGIFPASPGSEFEDVSLRTPDSAVPNYQQDTPTNGNTSGGNNARKNESGCASCLGSCAAWKAYFKHRVCFAGLGLAALYMTVLGFDSITTGKHLDLLTTQNKILISYDYSICLRSRC